MEALPITRLHPGAVQTLLVVQEAGVAADDEDERQGDGAMLFWCAPTSADSAAAKPSPRVAGRL